MREPRSRRNFLGAMSAAGAAIGLVPRAATAREDEAPAILGGKPVRDRPFPDWPVIGENDEKAWKDVLRKKTLVPARRRLCQPVRSRLGRTLGRQALPGRRQRHECARSRRWPRWASGPVTK